MKHGWLGFLVVAGVVGCESGGPRGFVGQLDGVDSRFAMVVDGDKGDVYVCGGAADKGRHHHWFVVESSADGFVAEKAADSVQLVVDGDVVSGTMVLGGETFQAAGTRAQGVDGLYEPDREEGACQMGTVVAEGGTVVQGVFCPDANTAVQVVPIDEIYGVAPGGFDAQALTDPPTDFFMSPVLSDGGL